MKNLIYAALALFGVLITVVISSTLLSGSIRELEKRIDSYDLVEGIAYARVEQDFKAIYEDFNTRAPILSLLVSDSAILEIEHSFIDVIGNAVAESEEGVITSVGRLRADLEHLRELAGFTVKSIF